MTFVMLAILGGILSVTKAADVLPEAGKTYLIKSDNVNTSKVDEDYYLYNDNGELKLSATKSNSANYQWTCEKNGENFRFKNKAGKYLAFKTMSDAAYDFTIDPTKKINEGCLPLYGLHQNEGKYMLVKNGGSGFDQARETFNKQTTNFSSDYIFEEYDENAKTLSVITDPAGVSAQFSWNGKTYTGSCSFTLGGDEEVTAPTLTVAEDPASPYEFIGFYEGDKALGQSVNIASLAADRNINAKFEFNIYSATYGEKWIRVTWNSNQSYVMGLPVSDSYADVAPKTITSDLGTETQLWCFVGTAQSFKIYNKAAGQDLALATASTSYGDGTATFMKAAASATSWHLVSTAKGLNISPVGNTAWGLNSYGGAGQALKLYGNDDQGNIWTFQKSGENALNFQVLVNGTPKALNTNIGQLKMQLGSISNIINVNLSQTEVQKFYLADNVKLNFSLGGTQYRGYKFKGFQVNDGALQETIEDLPFDASLKKITAVYDVDTEDPSQYLFYTPGYQNHPYRIPAITTTKDNKVLAISDFRWCNNDIGFGHVDIVGRISEDNGNTWSDQFNIAVGSGVSGAKDCGYGDAAVVTDRETGKILIMCCTGNVFYSNGTRENPLRSARLYSEDNGKTWSKPEDITEQMYALLPQSTGQFIGAGKICQSRVTKVGEYYRLYAALCTRIGNYVIYSDDFGQTWAVLGGNETSCAPSGDEPKCEELPDGSVVLSSRKYSGRYFNIYKYTDAATAEGKWLGVVSSNDIKGGLAVGNNSTNGEIQFVKVIKKDDQSFHYMMIQSLPYGVINNGDEARSNVAIYYKVFDEYTMNSSTDLATGWTQGMVFKNAKGAYSTMCIQPDKKLGFFYEEGPNNYCMVYRPISIEQLTNDAYTLYDPEEHGPVDELQRAIDLEKAKVKAVLDEYADKNNDTPALGECTPAAYARLQAAYDNANAENYLQLGEAINKMLASCNWPIFTIDNKNTTYGVGNSIYDNNSGTLYFKATNKEDVQMWWKFNGLASETLTYGDYVVTNPGTGRLFWDAEFLNVSATDPEKDGCFIIKTNGSGDPVHAQQNGSVIVRWGSYGPESASSWGVTYVGNSFELELPAVKATFSNTLAEAKDYTIGTTVGTYLDADGSFTKALQAAEEAESNLDEFNADEIHAMVNALSSAMAKLTLNMPQAGKYYRFKGTTDAYLSSTVADQTSGKPGRMMMTETADENTVFYLTADNRLITPKGIAVFEYFIERQNTGLGSEFTFEEADKGQFFIVTEHSTYGASGRGSWYATAAGQPVDRWTSGYTGKTNCIWKIEEVSDAEMQLSREIEKDSYVTMAAPVALNIPAGVSAYTVTVDEAKEAAILEEVKDVIPAGTAVVLENQGETDNFKFTFAPSGSTDNENNLTGVYVETAIAADINAYILANGDRGFGFYQLDGTDRTLGANKAYLALPASLSHIRSIIIGGPTTGIEGTVTEAADTEEYYDLQGRRVLNPVKGIYVTKSGKKVVFNK